MHPAGPVRPGPDPGISPVTAELQDLIYFLNQFGCIIETACVFQVNGKIPGRPAVIIASACPDQPGIQVRILKQTLQVLLPAADDRVQIAVGQNRRSGGHKTETVMEDP